MLLHKRDRIGVTEIFLLGEDKGNARSTGLSPPGALGRCPGPGGPQVPGHVVINAGVRRDYNSSRAESVRVSHLDRTGEAREAQGGEWPTPLPIGMLILSQGHTVRRGLWESRKTSLR